MPKFDIDTIESDSINIDVDDYVNACTRTEISGLLSEIKREYPYIFDSEVEDEINDAVNTALEQRDLEELEESPRSEGQRIFNRYINTLKQEWISISKEDTDIIATIAKKYGAL